MAQDIPESFVRQYESEVHEAYQRRGSKLRNTVRRKNNVTGESTTFQKVGKGAAGKKTRHGKVPTMNIDHTPVTCTLEDHYAGDWNDKLDNLKVQHDERQVIVNAGAYAMGRKTDEIIIDDALTQTTNQIAVDFDGDSTNENMTIDKAIASMVNLGERDVQVEDGNVTCVVGWSQWGKLMQTKEFANAEYVPANELPFAGRGLFAKRWMGGMWMPHSGLPKNGDIRSCFVYHMTAAAHASGAEMQTDITWHGDYASWFINNMMSQGAVLVDTDGIEEILCDETK